MTTAAAIAFLVILLPLCTLALVLALLGVVKALWKIADAVRKDAP